jgi:membrane protease YdiL (CAAX protease family)
MGHVVTTSAPAPAPASGWKRFWERGGWWRAVLVAAGYVALYLGAGLLIGRLLGPQLTDGGPLGSVINVVTYFLLPIGIGVILIVAFLATVGWLRPVFGRQPVRGRWWMWIAVAVVAYPIILRLIGIDYGAYAPGVVALTLLSGLMIGAAEELVTRGAAVMLLRKGGYSEWVVAVLSSLIFALMHSANAIGTGFTLTVVLTIPYTFCFGLCMYLIMRVTGNIVWAIIAHALTDPTLFLANGAVDATSGTVHQNAALILAGTGNITVILMGIVALIFIRGRVGRDALAGPGLRVGDGVGAA